MINAQPVRNVTVVDKDADSGQPCFLEPLQVAIGYVFRDVVLAECAITLPSWYVETAVGRDNQRLEFLGDAVLGLLAANHLYNSFPDLMRGR